MRFDLNWTYLPDQSGSMQAESRENAEADDDPLDSKCCAGPAGFRIAPEATAAKRSAARGKEGRNFVDALESVLGTPQWSDLYSLDSETLETFAPAVELVQVGQQ